MKTLSILFLSLFIGCSYPSEDIGSISQAQNGGQICGGTYNPFSPNYPFPARGWCQWMASPLGTTDPTGVTCEKTGQVPRTSEVFAWGDYSGFGFCARWPKNTDMDFAHMAFNGWNNTEIDGTPRRIRHVVIGPHTWWEASNGEYFNGTGNVVIANWTDNQIFTWTTPIGFEINSTYNYSYYGGPLD